MAQAAGRYTLLLDDDANKLVDYLQKALKLRSRAAVFDTGISLLKWCVDAQIEGNKIGKSNGAQFQELFLPISKSLEPSIPPITEKM